MIAHVVTFVFNPETGPDDVAEVTALLDALPGQIEVLQDYRHGPDLGLTAGNGDFAIVATVADEAGLRAYAEHPAHVEVVTLLRAMAASRTAVQIAVA
jgi:Stress responsive A/B Barrel Domain